MNERDTISKEREKRKRGKEGVWPKEERPLMAVIEADCSDWLCSVIWLCAVAVQRQRQRQRQRH